MIDRMLDRKEEYETLRFDEPFERPDPGPASSDALRRAESQIGRSLPPDLRHFLSIRDGFDYMDGRAKILGTSDYGAPWVTEALAAYDELFVEFSAVNPLRAGAIPVMLGEDTRPMVLFETPAGGDAGEYVEYDWVEEIDRYPTLFAWLEGDLSVIDTLIDRELNGTGEG
ncbi:SMI1/KNR4 family protein [Ruegeria sp. WL0004]|uniref:SMI1/KNR4 family protein n=1 Tax=Ruegeria marisflavi TaxID=2984152 RepID=A0ABT2WW06_9RHOB|nr:SMI1/KNR4 family protein [Ruegeria sp. WL0004]MCU9840061.1 SMI1/KNR4 family protein [Ruegeria sp. WL0004]